MRDYFILLNLLMLTAGFSVAVRAQRSFDADAQTLEFLQDSIRRLDTDQRLRMEADKSALTKGEFKTTAEFEKRNQLREDGTWREQMELWSQQGPDRDEAYSRLNSILAKEYVEKVTLEIGNYDADNQTFAIAYNGDLLSVLGVPRQNAREYKEHFRQATADARVGLRLDQNDIAREYVISAHLSVDGIMYEFQRPNLDLATAMKLMFGNFVDSTRRSAWKMDVPDEEKDYETYKLSVVYATPLGVIDYIEGGISKKLVVAKTGSPGKVWDCHACAMFISVGVFAKSGGCWKVEQVHKNATWSGGWGDVTMPTLSKIGPNRFALRFDEFDQGQGYELGSSQYFEVGNRLLKLVLYLQTHADNTGAVPEIQKQFKQDIKVAFQAGRNVDYFDAIFFVTGKKPAKIGRRFLLTPFSRKEVHPFSDGLYFRDGAP